MKASKIYKSSFDLISENSIMQAVPRFLHKTKSTNEAASDSAPFKRASTMTLSVEDDTATTASQPPAHSNCGKGDLTTSDNGAAFLTKQRSMVIPLVSLDLNKGLEAISEKAVHSLPPRSPTCGTNLGKAMLARGPSDSTDD